MNAWRPGRIVQRFIEVYAREGDCTSHLVCKIDFSAGVVVIHHRGQTHVVMLNQEYERWCRQYEPDIMHQEALTG